MKAERGASFNCRGKVSHKLVIVLLFAVLIVLWYWLGSSLLYVGEPNPPESVAPKAAIIDGIYSTSPNDRFIKEAVDCFGEMNFTTDLYLGENVTINLLMNLPSKYRIVVLRLHSAVHTDHFIYLFSAELYNEKDYLLEQIEGAVKKAFTFTDGGPYFALRGDLLSYKKPESLKGSLVILMGCNGTNDPVFMNKLIERGAAAYVGWTGYVDLRHTDSATLFLLKKLCVDNLDLGEAVKATMKEVGPDPVYGSALHYFPKEKSGFKLEQAILFNSNRILHVLTEPSRIAKENRHILDFK